MRHLPALLAALLVVGTAMPALAANPTRPVFRETKADFHDKELTLSYAWGGSGSMDFALLSPLAFGVGVDNILAPNSWIYRTTLKLVDEETQGLGIAFTAAATNIREVIAGSPNNQPVWGWQAGLFTTLLTESGLTFRLGIQAYDTEWSAPGGQQVLLTPEVAYRFGILEVMLVPQWPFNELKGDWVGARVRF
jgi:hypothetical protein